MKRQLRSFFVLLGLLSQHLPPSLITTDGRNDKIDASTVVNKTPAVDGEKKEDQEDEEDEAQDDER